MFFRPREREKVSSQILNNGGANERFPYAIFCMIPDGKSAIKVKLRGRLLFDEYFLPNFLLRPGQLTKLFCLDRK